MTHALIALWLLSAIPLLFVKKILRMLVYMGVYSLITSIVFLAMGAPDVALAEASISIFATIFFITCFEKYYNLQKEYSVTKLKDYLLPAIFTVVAIFLFLRVVPTEEVNTYAMVQYITYFAQEVGGENAVTSIYLGYRLYDTVFEALMLIVAAVAISHVSWHRSAVAQDKRKSIIVSNQVINVIRIICPLLLVFGIYLIVYGHLSPGGGFQGGVAVAAFLVCKYMVHDINDLPVSSINKGEKLVFASIVVAAAFVVFLGLHTYFPPNLAPFLQNVFLITMNSLLGMKVALGFTMLFYRFIAIERL